MIIDIKRIFFWFFSIMKLTVSLAKHNFKLILIGIIYFFIVTITSQCASKFIVPKYRKSSGMYNYIKLVILLSVVIVLKSINVNILHKLLSIFRFINEKTDSNMIKEMRSSIFTGFGMFIWLGKDIKEYLPVLTLPF